MNKDTDLYIRFKEHEYVLKSWVVYSLFVVVVLITLWVMK